MFTQNPHDKERDEKFVSGRSIMLNCERAVYEVHMMKIQINPSNELQCVTANLTLHMMSKIEFQPDFFNPQMHSFQNNFITLLGQKWAVWP